MYKDFESLDSITPPLTKKVKNTIDSRFRSSGYLFKESQTKTAYCSCCEKQFSFNCSDYKHNDTGYCPSCNTPVTMKDAGRGRGKLQDYLYFGVFQNLKGGILCLRTFLCIRDYFCSYHNAPVLYEEKYRVYFINGKRLSFKNSYWNGWHGINKLPRLSDYSISTFFAYTRKTFDIEYINPEIIERTKHFKYSSADEVAKIIPDYYFHNYIDLYNRYPIITEKLHKSGFDNVLEVMVNGTGYLSFNYRSNDLRRFLKMNNEELKKLRGMSLNATINALRAKSFRLPINDDSMKFAAEHCYYSYSEIRYRIASLGINLNTDEVLDYLVKRNGRVVEYCDYVRWLIKWQYDINSKSLYPRNLKQAHDEMMKYDERMEQAIKLEEIKKKQENFVNKLLPAYSKKYSYSALGYTIRPFANVEEMIDEGQVQHICVGGTHYTESYITGRTIIFSLRKADEPDKPYCTVEISTKGKIIQARMHHNHTPPDEVKQFLEKWQSYYNSKKREAV